MQARQDEPDSDAQAQPRQDTQPKFISRNVIKSVNLAKIIINISDCQYPIVRTVAKELKWKSQVDPQRTDWDVWWTDNAILPETLFRMLPHQKINHFPGMYIIARKNLLGKGLMKLRKSFPEEFDYFPLTWMLPSEYSQFRLYYQSKPKGKSRTFIVKPEALSQGKGIFLTRRIEDIPLGEHFVVQRYLHKPYLVDGLKFDFRIYVLLASVDPLRVYLYNQGLARFATEAYIVPTFDNMQNVCMHLTNYAINKDNPKFVFNTSDKDMTVGHKRSLSAVYELLASKGIDVVALKQKIKEIVVKTLISGLPLLRHQYRSSQFDNFSSNMCFQILGFDILLDSKAQPYLLEVNHTPSFVTDTPLDELIKKNLIKDSLILMNINTKVKSDAITKKKQELNQKAMNIKKPKISDQQKQVLRAQKLRQRDEYEMENLGGFQRIFPTSNSKLATKYQELIQFTRKAFQESLGIRKKPPQKQKFPQPKIKSPIKITPTKPVVNKLKQVKIAPQDQSILPYLKSIHKSIYEQFKVPPSVEVGENSFSLAPEELQQNPVYSNLEKRLSNFKIAKNMPSQQEIVRLFNKSYVQYKFLKEQLTRKRISSQKDTEPDSRHEVDIEPQGDQFIRQFHNDPDPAAMHSLADISGMDQKHSKRNFSHKARLTEGERSIRNRSTIGSISNQRRVPDEPLSAGLPK